MKKISIYILVLLIAMNVVACGGDNSENSETPSSESATSEQISVDDSSALDESKEISDEVSEETSEEKSEDTSEEESSEETEKIYHTSFADPLEVGYTKIENPFHPSIADPAIAYHDGKYYCLFGAWGYFFVSTFDSLENFTTDGASPVLAVQPDKEWSGDIWAPELQYMDGYWYIYFTGGTEGDNSTHRMYVSKSKTSDPMGEYEEPVKLTDPTDKWAIDGTIFKYKNQLYFIWSGWEGDINVRQNLYIAKMETPTKISGERYLISTPTYGWEKRGGNPFVNEGPCVIVDGDYLTILFSASGSWCDLYCIGQLLFTGDDVLDINSWTKMEEPIIKSVPEKFYGPGHCTVVPDENNVLWMVFHANLESGTGWYGRSGWMFPLRIDEKGKIEVITY